VIWGIVLFLHSHEIVRGQNTSRPIYDVYIDDVSWLSDCFIMLSSKPIIRVYERLPQGKRGVE